MHSCFFAFFDPPPRGGVDFSHFFEKVTFFDFFWAKAQQKSNQIHTKKF